MVLCYRPAEKLLSQTDFTAIRDCNQVVIAAGKFNAKHAYQGCPTVVSVEVVIELSSDHNLMLLLYSDQAEARKKTISQTKTDQKKFHNVFKEDLSPIPTINTEERLEKAVVNLELKISTSVNNSFKSFSDPKKLFQKVPVQILNLIRNKNSFKRTKPDLTGP